MQIKLLHIGGVDLGKERLCTVFKTTQPQVIHELNNWFFDYLYANQKPIRQLPPLDDWTHSTEDVTFWSVGFPEHDWCVWVKSDILEYK